MSVLTSLGILIFSALILAFLQFIPGVFSLFSHFMSGKFSKVKASDLTIFFILGVETAVTLILLSLFFILSSSSVIISAITSDIFAWIITGILIALCIVFLCCYYRKSSGTELFISRRLAHNYKHRIKTTKTRSDAFVLGLTAILPELVFTLPLYILSTAQIIQFDISSLSRSGLIILLAIITILPLLIIHILSVTHHNLADFIKFRIRHKQFFRFTIALFYLLLAIIVLLGALL